MSTHNIPTREYSFQQEHLQYLLTLWVGYFVLCTKKSPGAPQNEINLATILLPVKISFVTRQRIEFHGPILSLYHRYGVSKLLYVSVDLERNVLNLNGFRTE